jgi:hypothetical protein
MMKGKNAVKAVAAASLAAGYASAAVNVATVIKGVICSLIGDVIQLAWALAILMFIYGGAKYAYSADDPGGRKQAKSIAINAMIGMMIVGVAKTLIENIAGAGSLAGCGP